MKNIVLIGMSGVGKTTVGKVLATELNKNFFDTDILIETKFKISIEKIFSLYGETYFRELESKVIEEISNKENLIISTGGGTILDKNNITRLKKNGILILLDSSINNIVNNLKCSMVNRPLLNDKKGIYNKVKLMYNNRKDLYQSAADYIILVDNKSINEIVFEIRDIYDKINYWGKS